MEAGLREQGEPFLADQVTDLRITGVCTCGRSYCGSFLTTPRPMKRRFVRGRQVELPGLPGPVAVDIVGGEIAYVEVLHWDEVRDAVARVSLPS
jgi:hypothetical protein